MTRRSMANGPSCPSLRVSSAHSTSASPAPQIARDWGFTGEHGPTIRLKMATELKQGKLQSLKEEEGGYTEREKWMTW